MFSIDLKSIHRKAIASNLAEHTHGLCSVSAKDLLGKTVSKTRCGALMGYSAAAAGVATLLTGAAMLSGGAVGVLADLFRTSAVIALLGVVSLLAAIYISRMPDVSG